MRPARARAATSARRAAGPSRSPFHDRPALLGHRGSGRGAPSGHPENTLASLLAAVDAGLTWVELDVRRSSDTLVVLHDPWTAGGLRVLDRRADELRGAGIDRLDDVLAALPPEVGVDLDIKSSLEDALLPREETTPALLAPVVAAERTRRQLLVTSFDPAALLVLREEVPEVPLGLLFWVRFPIAHAIAATRHLGFEVVGLHVDSFTTARRDPAQARAEGVRAVDVAHRSGLQVLAWCPVPEAAVALVEDGVDALVVDDARGVRAALEAAGRLVS